jgi:serpin B
MNRLFSMPRPVLAVIAIAALLGPSGLFAQGDGLSQAADQAAAPTARAGQAASAPKAASAAEPGAGKDIVVDRPGAAPAAAPPAGAHIVPTPTAQAAILAPYKPLTTPVHDAAMASALADLALDLLRSDSSATGDAQRNVVVSSFSLASALGMVQAGAAGNTAAEISIAAGSLSTGERLYARYLPSLIRRLQSPSGKAKPLTVANRVWIETTVAGAIPAAYGRLLSERYGSQATLLDFAQAQAARSAINSWVDQQTAHKIPSLMPEGSISPTTRLVVTNAVHFKSPWARPFDRKLTQPRPFHVNAGPAKPVPTMIDERSVRTGIVDNVTVIEIPFEHGQFALLVGMPPAGHTLNAFETDLEGVDLAAWTTQLKPQTCRLELPRFNIAPVSRSLKPTLMSLGIRQAFSDDADFSPMLGRAAKGVSLDNVFQSAAITIDEAGGEAAAATGAAVVAKSFQLPAPSCAVDRPFIFAVVHLPSGAPLFVGKIADPSLP